MMTRDQVDGGKPGATFLAAKTWHQIGKGGISEAFAQQLHAAAGQPATAGTAQLYEAVGPVGKALLHAEDRRMHRYS